MVVHTCCAVLRARLARWRSAAWRGESRSRDRERRKASNRRGLLLERLACLGPLLRWQVPLNGSHFSPPCSLPLRLEKSTRTIAWLLYGAGPCAALN